MRARVPCSILSRAPRNVHLADVFARGAAFVTSNVLAKRALLIFLFFPSVPALAGYVFPTRGNVNNPPPPSLLARDISIA